VCKSKQEKIMTVELDQETPFIGVVATNRQKKKAVQGTEVEVRALKEGEYGPYALAFVNGSTKPVFLRLSNVDYVGPVSAERQAELNAELDAEREAWRARTNKPVVVGTDPDRETEKAVAFDWEVHSGRYGVKRVRLWFPKVTRKGAAIYNLDAGTVPKWIWTAKQSELSHDERLVRRWES
jgi:hypothetical protein